MSLETMLAPESDDTQWGGYAVPATYRFVAAKVRSSSAFPNGTQ